MSKQYTSHLCTFMGREANLKILLRYIELALEIDAIDNYWMIDMTRCPSDHEYIYSEQQRLNQKYPGRVHIYNRGARAKIINDKDKISESVGQWGTFYSFLKRFKDNDIIAKCDDDTLFIDVETLRAAFDFRWKHKRPFLIHANCINNGVTAYHQRKQGIWKDKETLLYPKCGLTGPLFSHPEIACDHHKQFTTDIKNNSNNIHKYQLKQNFNFTQRVSINFIFMLGTDRHELAKINSQDEYDTSAKYPQRLDRTNAIVGGFTVAHHTYGVQEPVMEERGTYDMYLDLADSYHDDAKRVNKQLNNTDLPLTTTIKHGKHYVAKHHSSAQSYTLYNAVNEKYLCVDSQRDEKIKVINKQKKPTGSFKLTTILSADDTQRQYFDIELNKAAPLLLTESTRMFRAGAKNGKVPFVDGAIRNGAFLVAKFFKGGYKKEHVEFVKQKDNTYKIRSAGCKNFFLKQNINDKTQKVNLVWEQDSDHTWKVEKVNRQNEVNLIDIVRGSQDNENDGTYSVVVGTGEKNYRPREFYWMVTGYIWEIIPCEDGFNFIKLVADDMEELYLNIHKNNNIVVGKQKGKWKINKGIIEHQSGKKINVQDNKLVVSEQSTKFKIL
jgi:hypothetical protein